jgi:hypothetical protein
MYVNEGRVRDVAQKVTSKRKMLSENIRGATITQSSAETRAIE